MRLNANPKRIVGELTLADLAKVVGGVVVVINGAGLQNKRRRRNVPA